MAAIFKRAYHFWQAQFFKEANKKRPHASLHEVVLSFNGFSLSLFFIDKKLLGDFSFSKMCSQGRLKN